MSPLHPRSVSVVLPGDVALHIAEDPGQVGGELRLLAAMKLFELGRLSSGAAAKLADVPRTVFLSRLADYGVDTFRLTRDDLAAETPLG